MGNRQNAPAWNAYNTWDLNAYSQMTGLSPLQIQQLQTAFNQQTASTGGRMTINEFRNIYAGIAGLSWNLDADAERVFLMFDADGNGVLTFNEFLMAYLMLQKSVTPVQRWTYLVNSYPVSQPGYLSAAEAQLLLSNMQRFYNFPMQETYFNTAWSQVGGGVNGYVPANSFIQAAVPLFPQTYIW
jgi:Ca2+-binding EF-hand superfamily protein